MVFIFKASWEIKTLFNTSHETSKRFLMVFYKYKLGIQVFVYQLIYSDYKLMFSFKHKYLKETLNIPFLQFVVIKFNMNTLSFVGYDNMMFFVNCSLSQIIPNIIKK